MALAALFESDGAANASHLCSHAQYIHSISAASVYTPNYCCAIAHIGIGMFVPYGMRHQ